MSLNESIVEDAALEWFGALGYSIGHEPQLAPGEPAADVFGPPPRISAPSSLNLDLSSPNLSSNSSVLLTNSCDSRKAMP